MSQAIIDPSTGRVVGDQADNLAGATNSGAASAGAAADTAASGFTPDQLAAIQQFSRSPEQSKILNGEFGGDLNAYGKWFINWWSDELAKPDGQHPDNFPGDKALLETLGFKADGGTTPVEQDLLQRVLDQYVYPSFQTDKDNKDKATKIIGDINGSIDTAIDKNKSLINSGFSSAAYLNQFPADQQAGMKAQLQDLVDKGIASNLDDAAQYHYNTVGKSQGLKPGINGQLLADYGNADDTAALLRGSVDAQAKTRQAALDQMNAERTRSLDSLAGTRLSSAETQVSGINQGLERTKDQLAAQSAAKGYTGGSSMEDANLARAVVGARQAAAENIGGVKVQNATDYRDLGDEISKGRYGITTDQAAGIRDATDTGTKMRSNYFDNNTSRSLSAALLPASLGAQKLGLITTADDIGNAGLTRGLSALNWFTNGATPPPAGSYTTQPSQVGNDIASLGAGILGGAINIGNANGWFKPSTVKSNVLNTPDANGNTMTPYKVTY